MPKRKDKNFVFDDGEDEDREDSVAIIDDDDDLSLKILEKPLSRRDVGNKLVMPIVWKDQDEEKVVEEVVKGEEEDDDEVEKSGEPKAGETSSNLVLKKLLRGARYFDPPGAGWVTCYSCGEQGHITVNCPNPTKRRKPCFICGSLEHGAKRCSKGHDCYICNKCGHRAKDFPDKYKSGSKGAVCLRCGDFGHDMILCNYEYSQEDLKDIQCYVCKSFGHLCCIEPSNSQSWAVSCYRCGQLGHTGLACGRHYDEINENDSVSPSYFKCGEKGHFSNSSSISTSQGRESPSLCYKCKEAGHFARECPNSSRDKWDTHLTRNFHLMQCIDQLLSQ